MEREVTSSALKISRAAWIPDRAPSQSSAFSSLGLTKRWNLGTVSFFSGKFQSGLPQTRVTHLFWHTDNSQCFRLIEARQIKEIRILMKLIKDRSGPILQICSGNDRNRVPFEQVRKFPSPLRILESCYAWGYCEQSTPS